MLNVTPIVQGSISVTSPKTGDKADPFNYVNVFWTRLGAQDANVSIALLRNGSVVATIIASTPNSGSYPWDLKPMAPDPGLYTIRVRTLDGAVEGLSGEFTIQEVGSITLLSPKGGEVWETGTSHAVTWSRTGNIQTLTFLVNRNGNSYQTLAQGVDAKLLTKSFVFVRMDPNEATSNCYTLLINHSGVGMMAVSGCLTLTGNPDLAVSATFSPIFFSVGTDVTFTITVENKGAVRSQPCQGSLSLNSAVLKTFSIPAIDPGTSATINVHWFYSGNGTITIRVDTGNANIEPDKANNTWTHNF